MEFLYRIIQCRLVCFRLCNECLAMPIHFGRRTLSIDVSPVPDDLQTLIFCIKFENPRSMVISSYRDAYKLPDTIAMGQPTNVPDTVDPPCRLVQFHWGVYRPHSTSTIHRPPLLCSPDSKSAAYAECHRHTLPSMLTSHPISNRTPVPVLSSPTTYIRTVCPHFVCYAPMPLR